MTRWRLMAVGGCAVLAACSDQVQQHGPLDGATRPQDASGLGTDVGDAGGDAGAPDGGVERLLGIDTEPRDAFDGQGVELGPEVEIGPLRWARGVQGITRVRGQFVWVGSGVDASGAWAYPILSFTPTADGRGTDRQYRWLNDAAGYRPTQTQAANNDTDFIVCSRDHWNGVPNTQQEHAYCRLLLNAPRGPLSLGPRRAPLGVTTGFVIGGDTWDSNRWRVLTWGLMPAPTWKILYVESDLSHEPSPPIIRRLPCLPAVASLATTGDLGWVVTSSSSGGCDDPHHLRVERVNLGDGSDDAAPIEIRLDAGEWARPGAEVGSFQMASDSANGVAALLARANLPAGEGDDAYFVRVYRDGRWGARRMAQREPAQFLLGIGRGEWVHGFLRASAGDAPNRLYIVRSDANGRRLGPPVEYASGLNIAPLGYGYEPEARALWLTYGVATSPNTDRNLYTVYLRRVGLNPSPR